MRQLSLAYLLGREEETNDFVSVSSEATIGHERNNDKIVLPMMVMAIGSFSIFSEGLLPQGWIYRLILFFLMNIVGVGFLQVGKKIVNNEYWRYTIYTILIIIILQFPMKNYFNLNLHDEMRWKHTVEHSKKVLLPTIYTNITFSKIQHEYKLGEIAKWYRIPESSYLPDEGKLFYNLIPNDMNYCNYKARVESEWLGYLKAAKDMTLIPLNRMKILEKFNSTMSFKLYKSISKVVNSVKSVHDLNLTKTRLEQGISNECKGEYFKLIWWDFNKDSIINCTYIIKFSNTSSHKNRFQTILDLERQQLDASETRYLENLYKPEYKWAVARRTIFDTEIFVSIQSKTMNEDFEELLTPFKNTTTYSSTTNQCNEEQHTTYLGDFKLVNETRLDWVYSYYPIPFYTGIFVASCAYVAVFACELLLIILVGFGINQHVIGNDYVLQEPAENELLLNNNQCETQAGDSSFSVKRDVFVFNPMNESNEIKIMAPTHEEMLFEITPFEELRNARKSRPNQSSDSISQDSSDEQQEASQPSDLFSEEIAPQIQEQTNLFFNRVTRRKNPSTKRSFALTTETILDVMTDEETQEEHIASPSLKKLKEII